MVEIGVGVLTGVVMEVLVKQVHVGVDIVGTGSITLLLVPIYI